MEKKMINLGQREFTQESYANILKSRAKISAPGKYRVKARQNNLYTPAEGNARYIVNLQAVTPFHIATAKKAIAEGDFQKALNQNLTVSVWVNEDGSHGFLPANGESVFVEVSTMINKQGESMLVVDTISPVPVSETTSAAADFDGIFSGSEENELESIKKEAEAQAKAKVTTE